MRVQAPDLMCADPGRIHAHITLLGPFVPRAAIDAALLRRLVPIVGSTDAFDFQLAKVARFPSGLVYLVPWPDHPFHDLISMLTRTFPDYPPYGGQVADVIPHLSIGQANDQATFDELHAMIAPALPISARALEVRLEWWDGPATETLARFPLGSQGNPTSPPR